MIACMTRTDETTRAPSSEAGGLVGSSHCCGRLRAIAAVRPITVTVSMSR